MKKTIIIQITLEGSEKAVLRATPEIRRQARYYAHELSDEEIEIGDEIVTLDSVVIEPKTS